MCIYVSFVREGVMCYMPDLLELLDKKCYEGYEKQIAKLNCWQGVFSGT